MFTSPRFVLGLSLWQLVVLFTPISLYGFWTDVVVFAVWIAFTIAIAMDLTNAKAWLRWTCRAVGLCIIVGIAALFSNLGGMFFLLELTSSRSIPQEQKVQGTFLVNQYFIPVGAYGCGMGRLITAKASIYFPLIEYRTEYDPCTHEDWGYVIEHGSWEGYPN